MDRASVKLSVIPLLSVTELLTPVVVRVMAETLDDLLIYYDSRIINSSVIVSVS